MTLKHYVQPDGTWAGSFESLDDSESLAEIATILEVASVVEVPSAPDHNKDVWNFDTQSYDIYTWKFSFGKTVELTALGLLPKHEGQSYFTADLKNKIWNTKQAIADAIDLGLYTQAKDLIDSIGLQDIPEMVADYNTVIALFSSYGNGGPQ